MLLFQHRLSPRALLCVPLPHPTEHSPHSDASSSLFSVPVMALVALLQSSHWVMWRWWLWVWFFDKQADHVLKQLRYRYEIEVISAVYDAVAKTTFLVLLDAEDMNSGPICTIDLKRHLPYGFHGSWKMPKEAQLKQNVTRNSFAKL